MIHFIIGVTAATSFFFIINLARRNNLRLFWYHWLFSLLCLCYTVFIVEVIVGFVFEGALRAALVMGILLGIPALISGILLVRFVFVKK